MGGLVRALRKPIFIEDALAGASIHDSIESPRKMNRAYRLAPACGILPLTIGISIFLLWPVTLRERLMDAGACTLYAGTTCVVIGAGASPPK